jgi:hypothetical protein
MRRFLFGTFAAGLFAAAVSAQEPAQPPKGIAVDRGRPTRHDDPLPNFDFAYFIGRWTFDWDVPEGPLGAAGTITGETVYRATGANTYEAVTAAKGPDGAFTIKEAITYDKDAKSASREVTDSRGFSYTQTATIGGDLGGFYNIFFESAPFTAGGRSVRIKHNIRTGSPLAYRQAISVSVDGGPYRNYGNPWWRKAE